MKNTRYMTAHEAAETLGITPATLYAYVSRGLVRSEAGRDGSRARRYLVEDIEKLKARKEYRHDPTKVAQDSLDWGTPVLDSAITLIADHHVYYRGQDALKLAVEGTIEQVAALIWGAVADKLFAGSQHDLEIAAQIDTSLSPMQKLQIALVVAYGRDLAAYDLQAEAVMQTGGRILHLMTAVLVGHGKGSIAGRLQAAWCPQQAAGERLLNAALILCADHELNASSFTGRVVASADANPYQVVIAGLAALQGFKHGANTELTEAFLAGLGSDIYRAIAERLRRGERIPGFGHKLYPQGDPRATTLLALLANTCDAPMLKTANEVIRIMQEVRGVAPNIDFALATLGQSLGLPRNASLVIFSLGRTVGLIGHAIEQYQSGQLIRPRARYTGEIPKEG